MQKQKNPSNWLNHFDSHMILIAAFRYFLGRTTAVTGYFAQNLATAWPDIPEKTKEVIHLELEKAFAEDDKNRAEKSHYRRLGMDMDRETWQKVRDLWLQP
jgi:hypothetical protein